MQNESQYVRFLAGAVASSAAEMATLPIDCSKVRLQAQGMGTIAKGAVQYHGMVDTIQKVVKFEGASALWKGATPAVARQISYSSMCMVMYEPLRNMFMKNTNGQATFVQKLMAGGIAGGISISIANPYVL